MLDLYRALQGINTVPKVKDKVTYDDQSQYLYIDFGNGEQDRKVVKAPSNADVVFYNNTASGTAVDTVQEALDQIYMALDWGNVEIYGDDENTTMIIEGGFANDLNQTILLTSIEADDSRNALIA